MRESRLALLLIAVALLTAFGGGRVVAVAAFQEFDLSPSHLGWLFSASGLGGAIATTAFVVLLDRRGPRPFMPHGVLALAIGMFVLAASPGVLLFAVGGAITGAGGAAVALVILVSVAAKLTVRNRGAIIGAIAAVELLRRGGLPGLVGEDGWRIAAVIAGVFALIAAGLLYRYLPRTAVQSQAAPRTEWRRAGPDPWQSWYHLRTTPGFWPTVAGVGLVFMLAMAMRSALTIAGPWMLHDLTGSSEAVAWGSGMLRALMAVGALCLGIAADRVPAGRLLAGAGLVAMLFAPTLFLMHGGFLDALLLAPVYLAVGGAFSLPWILLADRVGTRYIAVLGFVITLLAGIPGSGLSPALVGWLLSFSQMAGPVIVLATFGGLLALVAWRTPARLQAERSPAEADSAS